MAVTKFRDTTYNLTGLLDQINQGALGLPDIQRPFVWKSAKVRDLFDSMYKGFPIGYLLFWSTGAEAGARQIGTADKHTAPQHLIVDGQQRLTSLYAVITGAPIVTKDYKESRIRIAFRPSDQTFEVTDAAIERDPEFIPDISVVFDGGFLSLVKGFLHDLEEYRGVPLTVAEEDDLSESIDRLKDLQNYPFKAIELDSTVDEELVAEVFVRINSEGVQLNQADFILTLMSVFWEKGRRMLEDFSRDAKQPSMGGPSPFNHFIEPSPDQMLRVAVALAFRRGRLQHVYSILRGKDLDTGDFSPERRDEQFSRLEEAMDYALNLTNWHEFLSSLTAAGFRSSRMVTSATALLYGYALWLIGKRDYGLSHADLRQLFRRWFFMTHTTGRYTSSPESQIENDLIRLRTIKPGDSVAFAAVLNKTIEDTFTADYWKITLPNRLDSSSARSPALSAYWASLILLDADLLFSDKKVSSMLDPAITPVKSIERHHLFPKAYLATMNITATYPVNAIANMAFLDWNENLSISDSPPSTYWSEISVHMDPSVLKTQIIHHALPIGWDQLGYDEFLEKRRQLIARVVQHGFESLRSPTASMDGDVKPSEADLAFDIESNVLEFKSTARYNLHTGEKDRKLEHVIVKTVTGFMNSEGGILVVGVSDTGAVLGLDDDYKTLSGKPNRDGYELFLRELIDKSISGPALGLVRVSFEEVDDRDICKVTVAASAKPVFSRPRGGGEYAEFWVRFGNQTRQLHGTDMVEYRDVHWG